MTWKVVVNKTALKALKRMPSSDRNRILSIIKEMEINPFNGDIKMLAGTLKGRYRRRTGSWRIFYTSESEIKIVDIVDIKRRTSKTYS